MTLTADELKKVASEAIDRCADELKTISDAIWRMPELKYEEHHAHKVLTEYLEEKNFPVEKHFITQTGFRSVYGDVTVINDVIKPNIAVLCEYDALPEIGHACGHNLIAEVGVGAAIGIKAALDAAKDAGKNLGTLTVHGTPGEEAGGGKVDFIRARAYDTVDAAIMAHPWPFSIVHLAGFIARELVTVRYHGKASHAAGFPWEGVNALDAAVMAYNNISVMRQQMKPTWRVHGVITNGGAKPNIIPEETSLDYYIRAPTVKELAALKEKTIACFKAAALATGCEVELEWGDKPYENLITNPTLGRLYEANARALGVESTRDVAMASSSTASTDMGNVSQVVPGLHPCFYIGEKVFNHTRPFTTLAGDPRAQPYTLNQAKALAMTAIDIYCQPHLVDKMKTELQNDLHGENS